MLAELKFNRFNQGEEECIYSFIANSYFSQQRLHCRDMAGNQSGF